VFCFFVESWLNFFSFVHFQVRESSLRALRRWIRSKRHRCRTDPVFLLRFLRSQKFRLDKTFTVLENYLRMRRDNPDWFSKLDPTVPVVAEMVI